MEQTDEVKICTKMRTVSPILLLIMTSVILYVFIIIMFGAKSVTVPPAIYVIYGFMITITFISSINSLKKDERVLITIDKEGLRLLNAKEGHKWENIKQICFTKRSLQIKTDKTKKLVPMLKWSIISAFDTNLLIETIKKYKPENLDFTADDEILIYPNARYMSREYINQFMFVLILQFAILLIFNRIIFWGVLIIFVYTAILDNYYTLSVKKGKIKYHFKKREMEDIYINNKSLCIKYKGNEKIIVKNINKLMYTESEIQEKLKGGKA